MAGVIAECSGDAKAWVEAASNVNPFSFSCVEHVAGIELVNQLVLTMVAVTFLRRLFQARHASYLALLLVYSHLFALLAW